MVVIDLKNKEYNIKDILSIKAVTFIDSKETIEINTLSNLIHKNYSIPIPVLSNKKLHKLVGDIHYNKNNDNKIINLKDYIE